MQLFSELSIDHSPLVIMNRYTTGYDPLHDQLVLLDTLPGILGSWPGDSSTRCFTVRWRRAPGDHWGAKWIRLWIQGTDGLCLIPCGMSYPYGSRTREDKVMRLNFRFLVYVSMLQVLHDAKEEEIFKLCFSDVCDDVELADVETVSCDSVMPVTDRYNTFCL
jgi:hypothetical protein